MSGGKAVRIKKVEYAGEGLQLRVRWANGKTTAVDLHEPVHRLKGLRPRRDPKFFARVKLGEGGHSIAWPGDVDMVPRTVLLAWMGARAGAAAAGDSSCVARVIVNTSALSRNALQLIWQALRLPVFVFLAILQPVVGFVLRTLALLGVLMAFFFKLYGAPHFPFWLMLGISVGCGMTLVGYNALMRMFAR
ncbi:MAG: DUF2442 domain-containing protein [Steroidobacteraceae bacterium]